MVKNKLAIEFLIDRILGLRYAENPMKMKRKTSKYFGQWNKKDKAVACLSKVFNFIKNLKFLKN